MKGPEAKNLVTSFLSPPCMECYFPAKEEQVVIKKRYKGLIETILNKFDVAPVTLKSLAMYHKSK